MMSHVVAGVAQCFLVSSLHVFILFQARPAVHSSVVTTVASRRQQGASVTVIQASFSISRITAHVLVSNLVASHIYIYFILKVQK